MKKISLFIFSLICFVCSSGIVDASAFSLVPSKKNVVAGEEFTVTVKYTGTSLVSSKFNVQFNNVECTGSSSFGTVLSKCTGSACEVTLTYISEDGYGSSVNLYNLKCKSNNVGTSKFSVALYDGDAYDKDDNEVPVSSASTSVTVSAATTTTTTTKKVTTTTSRQVVTTKPSTKTTTTKKTTGTTSTKPISTTVVQNNEEVTTEAPSNTSEETTTTTEKTTTTKENTMVVPDDLKLEKLKIVGYKFDFKPNQTNYKIKVAKNVDELYVIAQPIDPNTKVTSLGVVNIEDKDYFIIKVYNELTFHSIEYKIVIDRKVDVVNSINNTIVFLALFVIIAISAVLLSIFKKGKVKLEKVDNVIIDPIKSSVLNSSKFIDEELIGNDETTELTTIQNIKNKDE